MTTWKRRDWVKVILAAVGATSLARLGLAANEDTKKFSADFGPDWQVQKEYTLEVAEAMPADKYSFKPAEGMRPFGELLVHVAWGLFGIASALRGAEPPEARKQPAEATKENVIPYLTAAFDYVAESIAGLSDQRAEETVSLFGGRLSLPGAKVCHFMRDHTTHHRAYALPYLRLNGITPPRYRFAGTRPSPV